MFLEFAVYHNTLVNVRNTITYFSLQNPSMTTFFIYITLTQLILFDTNVGGVLI